jgi:hypothetical protein
MACECGRFSLTEREWSVPSLDSRGSADELQLVLEEIAAVRGVRVKVGERTVLVGFDADYIGAPQLTAAMRRAGFAATLT